MRIQTESSPFMSLLHLWFENFHSAPQLQHKTFAMYTMKLRTTHRRRLACFIRPRNRQRIKIYGRRKDNKDYWNHLLSCARFETLSSVIINSVLWLFDKRHFNRNMSFGSTANKPFCCCYFKPRFYCKIKLTIFQPQVPGEGKVNFTSQKPSKGACVDSTRLSSLH